MIDHLKKSHVFKECTDQELAEIAKICQRISVKDEACIFEAEGAAEALYLVKEGVVDLRFTVTHRKASKDITLSRKFDGETFGWSAFAKPHTYTLSAFAVKDSELLKIEEKDLKKLCAENQHLGYLIMKNIADIIGERFASLQKILIDMIQQNLEAQEHQT